MTRQSTVRLRAVNPAGLYDPVPNGYSHAIITEGSACLAFIAGQGGEDLAGNLSPRFSDQVQQAFANLQIALDAAGASPDQVARLTTYVVDHDEARLGVITGQVQVMFGSHLPAQTLVPVPRLALDGMLFEVDATLVLA